MLIHVRGVHGGQLTCPCYRGPILLYIRRGVGVLFKGMVRVTSPMLDICHPLTPRTSATSRGGRMNGLDASPAHSVTLVDSTWWDCGGKDVS